VHRLGIHVTNAEITLEDFGDGLEWCRDCHTDLLQRDPASWQDVHPLTRVNFPLTAMNKKEAPQMIPGRVTRIQSAAPALAGGSVVALTRSAGAEDGTEAAVVEVAT
jgi:hypothetical protein